jgi:hypothetical protein
MNTKLVNDYSNRRRELSASLDREMECRYYAKYNQSPPPESRFVLQGRLLLVESILKIERNYTIASYVLRAHFSNLDIVPVCLRQRAIAAWNATQRGLRLQSGRSTNERGMRRISEAEFAKPADPIECVSVLEPVEGSWDLHAIPYVSSETVTLEAEEFVLEDLKIGESEVSGVRPTHDSEGNPIVYKSDDPMDSDFYRRRLRIPNMPDN